MRLYSQQGAHGKPAGAFVIPALYSNGHTVNRHRPHAKVNQRRATFMFAGMWEGGQSRSINMTDPVKGPGGRPSKYDEAFCEAVIDHMSTGASLTSFAADIGVARSTITEWADVHPEFSVAVNIAKAKCAAWWELQGRTLAQAGGGNATLVIFGLKNMAGDDWRDKHDHEHSGTVQVTGVQYTVVDPAKPEG